jgi:L-alanine-DL-glutamate epimerase-like enolase superfamily enzyme
MGYAHRKVAENGQTTVYERTDEGLFGWGILAAASKDYVVVDNQTGLAVSGSTVGEARAKLEHLEGKK